jgi:flagellar motor switch protein FliN/FliY
MVAPEDNQEQVSPEGTDDQTITETSASPSSDKTSGQSDTQAGTGAESSINLDFILDIPIEVTVELGRSKMLVNQLLRLGQGSVIELSKLAGETLEILANQKLIARGEVVVVNDKYGVRLTEVISPMERVERLK